MELKLASAFDQQVQENLLSQLVIHDEFEARYWARVLGMSRAEVRAAFGRVPEPADESTSGMAPGSVHLRENGRAGSGQQS